MARKCDTAKYRRRWERERVASIARKARNQKEEAAYWARVDAERRMAEAARVQHLKDIHPLVQRMVNALAKNICDRDPRYLPLLRLRQTGIFQLLHLFGGPRPDFPILPEVEEDNSLRIDDGHVIYVEKR